MHTIEVDLSTHEINRLLRFFIGKQKWLGRKTEEVCKRLAEMGAEKAEVNFAAAYYDGDEDHSITVEAKDGGYVVRASGKTVLFVEFGAGLIGGGHPEDHGMIPGSYSDTIGKGHWDDPNGWYYAHNRKSHGNPANMPMYNTVKELEQELIKVVMEVFAE